MKIDLPEVPFTTADFAENTGLDRHRAWKLLETMVRIDVLKKARSKENIYALPHVMVKTKIPPGFPLQGKDQEIADLISERYLSAIALAKIMGVKSNIMRHKLNRMVKRGILVSDSSKTLIKYSRAK